MVKIFTILLFISVSVIASDTYTVLAVTSTQPPAVDNTYVSSPAKYVNLGDLLNTLFKFIPLILGFVLLIFLIMGGITILTAGADEQKRAQGIKILTNAIIGTVIIVFAVSIVVFLQAILGQKILFG